MCIRDRNNALLMYKQFPQASQIKEFDDWADESGQDGLSDHTGIVQKVENGRVYTVEGLSLIHIFICPHGGTTAGVRNTARRNGAAQKPLTKSTVKARPRKIS